MQSPSLIISYGRCVQIELSSTASETSQFQPQTFGASAVLSERTTHYAVMRLKDLYSKFDGDLGDCWSEDVDSCVQIAKDYNLTSNQKIQYLHNVLSKDLLRFTWMLYKP